MPCRCIKWSDDFSLRRLFDSRQQPSPQIEGEVQNMLVQVKAKGDVALREYSHKFDCPALSLEQVPLRISQKDIDAANVKAEELDMIRQAAKNIRGFHQAQKQQSWFMTREDGSILGQKIDPVDRAGLYIPGGQGGNTPLISTLLMTAIPAQVAGVKDLVVVTPPRKDGSVNPHILAAAKELGISEIYGVGGAWSIGALAFGTQTIEPVNVIVGPGNIWVTTAKRLVQGLVGIDMLAGPSEVLIIADASARADYIAADMLSQAEHDSLASAICLTDDANLAAQVLKELDKQCKALPRAELASRSLKDYGAVIIVPNLETATILSNDIAPEHLELMVKDPWALLPQIRHAGAVFMGSHTPESLGDYFAGPNHVLPTLSTAKFSSALSVQTFCKRTSIIAASSDFARSASAAVAALARLEGLEAHARAMEIRNNHIMR